MPPVRGAITTTANLGHAHTRQPRAHTALYLRRSRRHSSPRRMARWAPWPLARPPPGPGAGTGGARSVTRSLTTYHSPRRMRRPAYKPGSLGGTTAARPLVPLAPSSQTAQCYSRYAQFRSPPGRRTPTRGTASRCCWLQASEKRAVRSSGDKVGGQSGRAECPRHLSPQRPLTRTQWHAPSLSGLHSPPSYSRSFLRSLFLYNSCEVFRCVTRCGCVLQAHNTGTISTPKHDLARSESHHEEDFAARKNVRRVDVCRVDLWSFDPSRRICATSCPPAALIAAHLKPSNTAPHHEDGRQFEGQSLLLTR